MTGVSGPRNLTQKVLGDHLLEGDLVPGEEIDLAVDQILIEDDVSTGDMAPDGALGMSLWSNIPECAKYMFRRRNLIGQGILPLLFREEDDYERASPGDEWKIEGVRKVVTAGEYTLLENTDDGTEISLEIRQSPREREVLLAGGTLKF